MTRRSLRSVAIASFAIAALVSAACSSSDPPAQPVAAASGWSRVTLGRPLPEDRGSVQAVSRVTVGRSGVWLALGTVSSGPGALQKPGAWASGDDVNWNAIGMPVEPAETGALQTAASDGSLALVGGAVGTGRSAIPSIWRSTDAWKWDAPIRLPVPPDTQGAVVHAITRGPGGWVAAGGASLGGDSSPLLWFSADGSAWNLGEAEVLPRSHSAWSVASSADRYVVVVSTNDLPARDRQAAAVVLASSDGRTWQRQTLAGFDDPVVVRSVLRVRDWFVLPVDCCGPEDQHRLAASRDGLSWGPGLTLSGLTSGPTSSPATDQAAPFAVTTLTERQGRLVAWSGERGVPWVWETSPTEDLSDVGLAKEQAWTPIELPLAPSPPYELAPEGYGTARLGTSGPTIMVARPSPTKQHFVYTIGDGKWIRSTADVAPPVRQSSETVMAMAGAGDRVVAVGRATYIPLGDGAPARSSQGRLWTSSGDLLAWDEIIINGNITELNSVASDGKWFVAVGRKGLDPVVMISRDAKVWAEVTAGADSEQALAAFLDPESARATATSAPATTIGRSAGEELFGGELPTSVVRFGDRYIVRTGVGGLWWSSSGTRWQSIELPVAEGGGGTRPAAQQPCASADVLLAPPYRSTDGEHWTIDPALVDPPFEFDEQACAVDPSATVVFVGAPNTTPPVAYSLWQGGRLEARPFELGTAVGVGWSGRWVMVGASLADPLHDPGAWDSTDGREWRAIAPATDLVREDGPGRLTSVLVRNDKLLLGGTHDDGALVLIGPA